MPLSSGSLRDLLSARVRPPGRWSGHPLAGEELVRTARREKLLPTLVSAEVVEGKSVPPGLVAELDAHRRRQARYRRIEERISSELGIAARVHKGRRIAARFPAGWVRASNDLDLQVDDPEQVIEIGCAFLACGWNVTQLTVVPDDGRLQFALDIIRVSRPDRFGGCDFIQVQSCDYLGPSWSVRPRVRLTGLDRLAQPQRDLLDLVASTVRRSPTARDVLDWSLLRPRSDAVALHPMLAELELMPEWHAVSLAAISSGWPEAPLTGFADATEAAPAAARIARRRMDRLRKLPLTSPADFFRAGGAIGGPPTEGSHRSAKLEMVFHPDGAATFTGPFGSGPLAVPAPGETTRMGWARE